MSWRERLHLLLKEPIIPFLMVGAALFGLQAFWSPGGSQGSAEIVVSDEQAATMVKAFVRTWQRPPSQEELQRLFDDHVRTEVLVREAMALGLDRNDTIVRRRLRQKMEFVNEGELKLSLASNQELQGHLMAHADSFRSEPLVSFEQVFLDPARRGDRLNRDAAAFKAQLNSKGQGLNPSALGDPLAMIESRWSEERRSELVAQFGSTFTDALLEQPRGSWVGPIPSAYGMHLVRVSSVKPGALPPLEQVLDAVQRDWQADQRQDQQEELYRQLLAKYSVRMPQP
ncbi:peptidyl-prolyl cis-trans isomerase [Synechococcus sp. MVIR-18-1]|uniref:peptidylprolyl isomerase n=1 Tax=Synechococcus sp. MVIR-18-1 TaxID=1386941 RepID=UPI0016480838|nr:peptidylprolyl isomerase [Synechococcus sp. MVIR-18-1]QNI77803.1 peptidyl-prolyl cis-trans isomerase (PPIASE) protein family [Synechococcus sp. MVIR-18-1]